MATSEMIAQNLRRLILNGEIARGGVLEPIPGLMARFGVSRPTLRNALRVLENEHLIVVKKGSRSGAEVRQPSIDAAGRVAAQSLQASGANLGDLYDAQLMIEPGAARVLAQRRDVRDITKLRAYQRHLSMGLERNDAAGLAADLARFHHLVVELTGNKVLALVSGLIADVLERHQQASREQGGAPPATPDMNVQTNGVKSIGKLVALIEAGDADAAELHWRTHITNANSYWLSLQDRFETINIFG